MNAGNGEDVIYETLEEGVDFSPVTYAVFGSSLFLAICGVFLSWCLFIKHKQKVKREEEEYRDKILNLARESRENACYSGGIGPGGYEANSKNSRLHAGKDIGETVSLLRRMPGEQPDRATRLLGEAMGRTDITFEDLADPSKYFRVPANGKIILGRSNSCCDMAFEYDDSVSSKHCEIFLRDEHWFVRDLGSSNGTYINGDKVYTELEIRTGDMLKMGTLAVIVRF